MIKYIFFDLDDTLINYRKSQDLACLYLYNHYHFNTKIGKKEFIKTWNQLSNYYYSLYTKKELSYEEQRIRRIRDLFSKYNLLMVQSELEIFNKYLEVFEKSWCLYDEVDDTLSKLKELGYKMGIISNGDLEQQRKKLIKTKIFHYMIDVVASSEYDFSKPDVRIFEEACKRNNIKYDEICYIGDSYEKDILPCLSLGIKAIWLNRNYEKIDDKKVVQINNLSQLFNLEDF